MKGLETKLFFISASQNKRNDKEQGEKLHARVTLSKICKMSK